MSANLLSALRQLDVNNDNHWTADGAPRLETVRMLAKDPTVNREAMALVAPGFSRAKGLPAAPAVSPAPVPAATMAPVQAVSEPASAPAVEQEHAPVPVDEPEQVETRSTITEKERVMLELARAKTELAVAQQRVAAATARLDELISEEQKAIPKQEFSLTVRAYLDSQDEIRRRRVAQMEALRGVDLRSIIPSKSKVDQAFARRNERGMQRPKIG